MNGTDTPMGQEAHLEALADELTAIRRRVVNVVGHELRTPVTTIHGLAGELSAADDLETVRDVIGPALLRNAARLTVLLDDLLVAAGIETAIPVDSPGHLELADEVRAIWGDLRSSMLQLEGPPTTVSGPLTGIRRALRAVLENAAAYGTSEPEVSITEDEGTVTVRVFSPGPDIHPEEARLATEPFFRGERAVTSQAGLGMGLSIAKAVAEGAGGTLSFEATVGGTLTSIVLPRAPIQ